MMLTLLFLTASPILIAPAAFADRLPVPAVTAPEPARVIFTAMRRSDQRGFMGIPVSDKPVTETCARYPEVPAWAEGGPSPKAWEIERLCDSVTQYLQNQQYDKAETALNEAISLNEPYFNSGMYSYLTNELSKLYLTQRRFPELEKLYETTSKRLHLWDSQEFRNSVGSFLMDQGRFAEARAILRQYVPKMTPPPPGARCANPYAEYSLAQNSYKRCVDKTRDMTEEQLDQIDRELKARYVAEPAK